MKKVLTNIICVLAALLLFMTGCAAKDDFAGHFAANYLPIEYLSAETEFAEYDGNAETVWVFLTNHRDEEFHFDYGWQLEKEVNGKWRAIRFIGPKREDDLLDRRMPPHDTTAIMCELKDNVKQPLLPGHYRLWVGRVNERVSAEFTIK